jgi:PAS domain S-box-containing protein
MIRPLLLENHRIESRNEYKYALLRGQLGLLLGAICFIYIFIDLFSGVIVYLPWYLTGIGMSMLVIFQNRKGKYLLASILLLITANMLVYLIASLENSQGGAFFYFMATSATSLVVLNPVNKRLGLLFVAVSITLAGIAYFGDLPLQHPAENESYIQTSFTVNFLLGLLSSVLILHFVMARNHESEDSLLQNQERLQDVTRELEKSQNRFALAVEGTKAGIYEWDVLTNHVYVSPRFRDLLGFGPEEDLGTNNPLLKGKVPPQDQTFAEYLLQRDMQDGATYQYESLLTLKTGESRWFLVSGIVSLKINALHLAVGSIIDIHDRKIAEQELRSKNDELQKTNQELDRFVYSASHDMRAPLSTLRGLLNLAKKTQELGEIESLHEKMINRIQTMEGFIREVTDYSRNTRLDIKPTNVNLLAVAEEIRRSFEFLLNEASVEYRIEIDPRAAFKTDKDRLNVILNNLVSNAIKYHDPAKVNRFVEISACVKDDHCLIRISDNGIGIPAQYQEKMFDMFFRASERSDGSGLGLYIVKETLQRLKGAITCVSEERMGSTFEVRLQAPDAT